MQKFHLLIFLFLLPCTLFAQQRTKIYVDKFLRSRTDLKNNISYLRNPVFRQDNAVLTCDSAVFYEKRNVFEAFNNVHINQADTVNIYSDRLTYDGNTKMAHLTTNVRLLDRESVLTTNILDYNMASKIGTYVTGGKIVNKEVTLTSKNGYYFANSRDAYFRYNVVVVTPETVIKSDTLRYNTLTNWTYFYGPTNIKGKTDNLYTENGAYNTKTQYAYFGKKNLYTQGSKSLKGDSLYYDGIAGYGKAVKNIVSMDTVDKFVMHGQLGYYYKIDQRTLVTKHAYFGLGTDDSIMVKGTKQRDTLWLGADTLESQVVLRKTLKIIPGPIILKDNEVGSEDPASADEGTDKAKTFSEPKSANKPATPGKTALTEKNESKRANRNRRKSDDKKLKPDIPDKKIDSALVGVRDSLLKDTALKDTANLKRLATALLKDTTQKTKLLAKDALHKGKLLAKDTTQSGKLGLVRDSSLKAATNSAIKAKADSTLKKVISKKGALTTSKKPLKDTVSTNPADTVTARIIKAYHKVNVYKTNMQAKADSLFYTTADSTLRWFYNPIMWSDGTQQTGDTIYLQMKNKKLNTVQVIEKAFTVNVYKDSLKFNQIKGKKITGFFKDGKMNSMYVDGNAESVYYTKDDDGKAYKEMNQTVSSRIKISFKDSEIQDVLTIKDPDGAITPVDQIKEEVILTGFQWKPELRPLSKDQVVNPKAVPKPKKSTKAPLKPKSGIAKSPPKKGSATQQAVKSLSGLTNQIKKVVDSVGVPTSIPTEIPSALKDTALKVLPGVIKAADSIRKQAIPLKKQ